MNREIRRGDRISIMVLPFIETHPAAGIAQPLIGRERLDARDPVARIQEQSDRPTIGAAEGDG
jgi:hypothetical protein